MIPETEMTIDLEMLMDLAVRKKASELQFKVGSPPVVALDGNLRPFNMPSLEPHDVLGLLQGIAPEQKLRELNGSGSCDFPYIFEGMAWFHAYARIVEGNCEFVLRLERTDEASSVLKRLPITEVDRRLSQRLDMPIMPYSSSLRLARSVGEFVASLGLRNWLLEKEGRKFLAARNGVLDRQYERPLASEADLAAELCRFLLDVLEGNAPRSP
jgi:hypothetical protein